MKLLGLVGGMSWENTIEYYRVINEMIKNRLKRWNSAKILLYSVNFEEIISLQNQNKWDKLTEIMIIICQKLESVGCSAIIICSNTMHKIANRIEKEISIPLIHVVDATAHEIKGNKLKKVGLLGTIFTMEGDFYKDRLRNKFDIETIVPEKESRENINDIIYNELAQGLLLNSTKEKLLSIIKKLKSQGAEGIILGCTELPLLIKANNTDIPLFDTMKIHLNAAVDFALSEEN